MSDHLSLFPDLQRRCLEQALSICNDDLVARSISCSATRSGCWLKLARLQAAADELDSAKQSFESSVSEYESEIEIEDPQEHNVKMYARLLKTYAAFLRLHFPKEADAIEESANTHDASATPIEFWEEVR